MKLFKKVVTLSLAALSVFSVAAVAGCGDKESRDVDPNKTQLLIGYKNDGYGPVWMKEAISLFEKKFADKSFEDGKKGVQVWVNYGTDEFNGYQFYSTYRSRDEDLYIGTTIWEGMRGDTNHMYDLTDLAKEPLTEFGETKSIYDKSHEWVKTAYDWDHKGVWSVAPGESYFGITVYDVDLFEEKKYYKKEGGGWTGDPAEKDAGFDGIKGTFDDGLPKTEAEYFQLLDIIKSRGDIPFTWSGVNDAYANAWLLNATLNYDDGVSQLIENTGYGEMTLIHKVSDRKYELDAEPTVFDGAKNFYEIARTPGKLAALKIGHNFIKARNEGYYSPEVYKTTQTHIEAQNEYLTSVLAGQRIAMIMEGTWWEMEADDTFTRMAKNDATYSKQNRRFGIMPPIKPTGSQATKHTFLADRQGAWIPNRTVTAGGGTFAAAKLFIKMLASDELLNRYMAVTNIPAAFDFNMSDETYKAMTYFGKQVYEISKNANNTCAFVSEFRDYHPAFIYNNAKHPQAFSSNIEDPNSFSSGTNSPMRFFKFDRNNKSAEDYFDSLYSYAVGIYDREYASYFGARK